MAGHVRGDGSGAMRIAAIVALMLLACVLVLRNATTSALAVGRPDVVLRIASGNPLALIERATAGGKKAGGRDLAAVKDLEVAAAGAPLSWQPYFAAAVRAEAAGNRDRAIRLGEAARLRNPRALPVHVLLLENYVRKARFADAIAEMDPVVALGGDPNAVANALSVMLANPRTAPLVAAAMRKNPRWRLALVQNSSQKLAEPGAIFDALVTNTRGDANVATEERNTFLNALTLKGDFERAYLAWVNFLPPSAVGRVAAIYDGKFEGLPGYRPFNWSFENNENGTVEATSDTTLPGGHALRVSYFGSVDATLATQLLYVAPGSYTFGMIARGETDASLTAGTLSWRLTCLPSQQIITLATFETPPKAVTRIATPVVIPATGCAAQRLTLVGKAGEVSTPVTMHFTDLALRPANGSAR